VYDEIVGALLRSVDPSFRWINENLLTHTLTFIKEFGTIIAFISAVIFLLISVYLIMKQARKLPNRYVIETFNLEGKRVEIPGLRVTFSTYQAAASYAQFYTTLHEGKYRFKLLGVRDNISVLRRVRGC
jgi:hypothetical protein